jgi:hypothetical protein
MNIKESILLSRKSNHKGTFSISLLCLAIAIFQIISCASPPQKPADQAMVSGQSSEVSTEPTHPEDRSAEIEQKWGVKILGIRQTANAFLLDFRFHVIDPEKASPLIGRHAKPYIIDEASGMKFSVPNMPKVGSLRARGNEPDRDYFIIFSNPNRIVKKGNKVTVIADDFKVEHLIVE